MSGHFDSELVIEFDRRASDALGDDYFRLKKSFRFYLPPSTVANEWVHYDSNRWAFCAAGMLTDLGSIPVPFRGLINRGGRAAQAFVLHDQLCEYLSITENGAPKLITRQEADLILLDALLALQVDRTTAYLIYNSVAGYQLATNTRAPSTTALKRQLEAAYNFEDI